MATHPEDWTCTICYDGFPASEKYCKIPHQDDAYHYRACATCLRTQFLSAQENEMRYPVKWQKQILHPRQFPGAFNQIFVRAYEAKEVEYKAPPLERCGTSFCYICGEKADSESEHWLRADDGGCPRYGAAERAMFDDDFNHADEDAIANVPANHMEIWERDQGESTTFDFIRWAW
ncbi:hypothetical protein MBLNU13_g08178t1 [Cladosporium sp. NU13]